MYLPINLNVSSPSNGFTKSLIRVGIAPFASLLFSTIPQMKFQRITNASVLLWTAVAFIPSLFGGVPQGIGAPSFERSERRSLRLLIWIAGSVTLDSGRVTFPFSSFFSARVSLILLISSFPSSVAVRYTLLASSFALTKSATSS